MREKLLGYPRNLSVYEVTSCPQNESSWKASAQRLGCNLEIVDPFTDFYYCIPTKSTSRLVEFCYDRSSKGQGEGRCLVLDEDGMHDSFDCTHFTQGCPDTHYLPEDIYNYPACLNINTEKSCYLAEKGCPPHTSSTVMDSTSEYISTNPYTSSPVTYISNAFWSSTTFEGLSTSSVTTEHPHLEVFVVFAVAAILCFIVAIMLMRRKKESIAGDDDDEETELMEPRDLPNQIRSCLVVAGTSVTTERSENAACDDNEEVEKSVKKKTLHPSVTLEEYFYPPKVDGCCHISCVTNDSAWISDRAIKFRLVHKHGDIMETKTGIVPNWSGSHTVTGEGKLLFLQRYENDVIRVIGDGKNITLNQENTSYSALCIYYSTKNRNILVGGTLENNIGLVKRYSEENELVQEILVDERNRHLYMRPWHITENVNGDVIVSDYDKQMVVAVDSHGRHRFNYTQRQSGYAFTPRGVCTDRVGHILVCDTSSESVHILTINGNLLSQLYTYKQDVKTPFSICFDKDFRLWVGDLVSSKICIYHYSQEEDSVN